MNTRRSIMTSVLCALVLLASGAVWASEVYHDNVVILLDASGERLGEDGSNCGSHQCYR